MKLRNAIISGLAGIVMAFSSGCPLNRPVPPPPEPSETVYTDPQQILDKFVINNGTGTVDVRNALASNPLKSWVGQLARTVKSNSTESLKAAGETYHIYVGQWNGTNTNGWLVFNEFYFQDAIALGNSVGEQNSQPVKYWLSKGLFTEDRDLYYKFTVPTEVEGQGTETISHIPFFGAERLNISKLRESGGAAYLVNASGNLEYAKVGIGFFKDGSLTNCELDDYGTIALNPNYDVTFTGNTFHNLDSTYFTPAIYFFDASPLLPGSKANSNRRNSLGTKSPQVSMQYNLFQDIPMALYVTTGFQAGDVFAGGNNSFIDVPTVVYCADGNTSNVDATGNYWATTNN